MYQTCTKPPRSYDFRSHVQVLLIVDWFPDQTPMGGSYVQQPTHIVSPPLCSVAAGGCVCVRVYVREGLTSLHPTVGVDAVKG